MLHLNKKKLRNSVYSMLGVFSATDMWGPKAHLLNGWARWLDCAASPHRNHELGRSTVQDLDEACISRL